MMKVPFSKMHGAGNDFIVLDETQVNYRLTPLQYRWLADRHFGIGADQILSVRPSTRADADFAYVIHNADGQEVEHCGNGARCFVRFVREKGLSTRSPLVVEVKKGLLLLQETDDQQVRVNMGPPCFDLAALSFDATGLQAQVYHSWQAWPLDQQQSQHHTIDNESGASWLVGLVSMGNPHAVHCVASSPPQALADYPVASLGEWVESHPRFQARVNAGFMQVISRSQIALRVYERGAKETLACGTGACAAVVCGIRWGLLDQEVQVLTRGGVLRIEWSGQLQDPVYLIGPATTIFHGEVQVPASADIEKAQAASLF